LKTRHLVPHPRLSRCLNLAEPARAANRFATNDGNSAIDDGRRRRTTQAT